MLNLEVPIWCIGAFVLGALLGYVFAYSTRQQQPNANEIAALLGTVLGGAALSLIQQFKACPEALPLYVIGAAIGYVLYTIFLKRSWTAVQHLISAHGLQRPPLLPWLAKDPCHSCESCRVEPPALSPPAAVADTAKPAGVDVSHYQGDINWMSVRCAGRSFAFIKATQGASYVDAKFARNWAAAKEAGVWRGAYHFFSPRVSVDAQIQNFLRTVGKLEVGDLPPVLDVESPEDWAGIPHEEKIQMILNWLRGVWQEVGVQPIIYSGPSFVTDVLRNDSRLAEFPLWVAHYTRDDHPKVPAPWRVWTFWQFTDRASVSGINGPVDADVFNGPVTQLAKMLKQAG